MLNISCPNFLFYLCKFLIVIFLVTFESGKAVSQNKMNWPSQVAINKGTESEAYLEPCQTHMMKLFYYFALLLTVFAEKLHLRYF